MMQIHQVQEVLPCTYSLLPIWKDRMECSNIFGDFLCDFPLFPNKSHMVNMHEAADISGSSQAIFRVTAKFVMISEVA